MSLSIIRSLFVGVIIFNGGQFVFAGEQNTQRLWEQVKKIHAESILVDGHNDLPWAIRKSQDMQITKYDISQLQSRYHTDIPRLKRGGVGAQFWSAYVPMSLVHTGEAVKVTLEQIALIKRMVQKYPDHFAMALNTDDIRKAHKAGKIASLIGVEGGHGIDNSLETLQKLYDIGTRYMTLTHSKNLDWVESATDLPMGLALNDFGKKVVQKMNTMGMLIDISHISARAMHEVLKVTKAPVIASHSSAFALKGHPRNVPDDVLEKVAKNRGVIMVNFYTAYLIYRDQEEVLMPLRNNLTGRLSYPIRQKASVKSVADHIDHIAKVCGIDCVGLGSDYDGVPTLPTGLEDVSKFPNLTYELLRRGYSEIHIKKILGENLMRAFAEAETYAATQKRVARIGQ